MIEMNEDYEISRISETAQQIALDLDLDPDEVAEWLTAWAIDWDTPDGLAFQIAAQQEFGATLSDYMRNRIERRGMNPDADYTTERSILRWLYENKRRMRPVTLYRGTDHDESNALESWTESEEIAQFYVERNGGGRVISREFSPDEILASWHDGVGLECAREVIVINR